MNRYRRYVGWDYSKGASLFVTMATSPRRALFGEISGGKVRLSRLGDIVKGAIEAMPELNRGLSIYGRVVMPDHIHFNCCLAPGLREPLKLFGGAIRRFKNFTTKQAKVMGLVAERSSAVRAEVAYPDGRTLGALQASPDGRTAGALQASPDGRTAFGHLLWQQGCHDYLLVSRAMIDSTERYIAYNPKKWELMHGSAALHVIEPLFSPRLDAGDYWKGVGNASLLSPEERLVSLRVSREVVSPRELARLLAKMESAAEKGWVIVSGFISKGEQAVRDMLCRKKGAKFIRVRASCIPNASFRPESCYVDAFAENRYLEIGKGNEEVDFGRGACLDLNAEIIEIATSCSGMALYWKASGPQVLARNEARVSAAPCHLPQNSVSYAAINHDASLRI